MGDIWASLWVHSMTRTSSHPCVFLIDIVLYWPRFVESLQYLHQWNKCFVYILYDACLYIYTYTGISAWWNLRETFFLNFSSNKSGVVKGPALSSLVAPQVVIATSGANRGCRVDFIAALDCSMFHVYSALTIYLISRPSFIQNSIRCSIARSFSIVLITCMLVGD